MLLPNEDWKEPMTTTLLMTIAMIALLMFAMAVGVIFSNIELKGSCGGTGSCACEEADLPRACDLVPGPGQPRCLPDPTTGCPMPTECPSANACPHEQGAS